jgi:hypothetical protein
LSKKHRGFQKSPVCQHSFDFIVIFFRHVLCNAKHAGTISFATGEGPMIRWLRELDRLLRGETTRVSALRRGTVEIPAGGLLATMVVLGGLYGLCMGSFALFQEGGPVKAQMVSAAIKVPALFLLTLAVTLPSLYVSNALVGSRLSLKAVVQLLVAAMSVMLAVLASLGPIVAFFSVITTSHPFIVLLNVAVFGVSGVLGLRFLLQTMHRLNLVLTDRYDPEPAELVDSPGSVELKAKSAMPPSPLSRLEGQSRSRAVQGIFRIWVVMFGLVGAQMSWVLRPFIGAPGEPFIMIAARGSNFFAAVLQAVRDVFV